MGRSLRLITLFSTLMYHAGAHQIEGELVYPANSAERAETVRRMFIDSYNAYRRFAWGHDDVRPISQTYADTRNGWGATMVDALDTMQIMGLQDFYHEALQKIKTTDFTRAKKEVNVFESSIRYIAGMLSAYELSGRHDKILLDKSVELADKLVTAWEGRNTLPWTYIYFDGRPPRREQVSVSSMSLILELRTLSKLSGNSTYLALAEMAQTTILNAPMPFPGLLPNAFWPPTGQIKNSWVTWGSGCDSAMEYLLKYYLLSGETRHRDSTAWKNAVRSTVKHIVYRSTQGHRFIGEHNGKKYLPDSAYLTMFAAGNWLLGAKALADEDIHGQAMELLESAWSTHTASPHGFGPDDFVVQEVTAPDSVPRKHRRQAERYGFYCTNCGYLLRPEAVESNFYAWRLTGDTKYQERAWRFVQDLKKLQVPSGGFAGLKDVYAKRPRRIDHTESFFYSETLKYLYLTFVPSISLNHFVFNTEAHPFAFDDAPLDAFTFGRSPSTTAGHVSPGSRGVSLNITFGLIGAALLTLLVHLVARLRGRRARLPSLRRDGIAGTGGLSRRSRSNVRNARRQ